MSRIRWKLLLTMLAVVAVTVALSAFFTRRVAHEELRRVLVARLVQPDVKPIEDFARTHRDWRGVESAIDAMHRRVVLADAQHRVIAVSRDLRGASVAVDAEDRVSIERGAAKMVLRFPPVHAGGALVYVLPENEPLAGPAMAAFDRRLLTALAAAMLVALLLTVLLSRQITRPVERLTVAVEEMTRGKLPAHVEAAGSDEIAQLARAFNRMSDAVANQQELRRRMVVDVAHELRTPLTNLRCELEAVQDGLASPDVASLHEEVLHLGRLVDDLQELAVADAGGLQLHRTRIDLGETVERAVDLFRPEAGRRSVAIATNSEEVFVDADATRVRQIVRNLVANAMQHTPDGARIDVRVRRGAEAIVSVANEGRGIPPDELENIFERFYRVDESRNRDSGGAGLGLAIVRRLVELHGGRVWAENYARGATFIFTLPLSS